MGKRLSEAQRNLTERLLSRRGDPVRTQRGYEEVGESCKPGTIPGDFLACLESFVLRLVDEYGIDFNLTSLVPPPNAECRKRQTTLILDAPPASAARRTFTFHAPESRVLVVDDLCVSVDDPYGASSLRIEWSIDGQRRGTNYQEDPSADELSVGLPGGVGGGGRDADLGVAGSGGSGFGLGNAGDFWKIGRIVLSDEQTLGLAVENVNRFLSIPLTISATLWKP